MHNHHGRGGGGPGPNQEPVLPEQVLQGLEPGPAVRLQQVTTASSDKTSPSFLQLAIG